MRGFLFSILLSVTIAGCGAQQKGASATAPPLPGWTNEIVLWPRAGDSERWRNDPALNGAFHSSEYPDDLQVEFLQDSALTPEYMWVRVLAVDPDTGEYLGVLLNQPHDVRSVSRGDNVVFRARSTKGFPIAVNRGDGYRRPGYPRYSPGAFLDHLVEGLSRYREGNFGHDQASIQAAATLLAAVPGYADSTTSAEALWAAHFYLGRCYAEQYTTELAVREFRESLRCRPDDPDSLFALLAEYSILAVTPQEKLKSGTTEEWKAEFARHEAHMRAVLPTDSRPIRDLDLIYQNNGNPKAMAGLATIRYKMK